MNNLFVTYDIALQLKEKGYDEPCLAWYGKPGDVFYCDGPEKNNYPNLKLTDIETGYDYTDSCSAPLYQQVVDWFREVQDIHIIIDTYYNPHRIDKVFFECAISTKDNDYGALLNGASLRLNHDWIAAPNKVNLFDTYYEALNKAIEEALKLI